jgi:hypothetical protein
MWRYKDKSRAWWFQNLPHGLQNRRRSCCRSHRRRRWGLPTPLFCPGCRWRSTHSPQCAWTASSFALRKQIPPLHGGRCWSLPTWPLRACTASSPGPMKNQPLLWSAEEDARGGAGSSSSPRNLTLLAGAADNNEEDGRGRGRGASSLQNLALQSRAIPASETRLRRGRRKPEKGIEGGRRGGVFIKKVRMRKWYDD